MPRGRHPFRVLEPQNRLYRNSPTTYAAYCEKHNFTYATRTIPQEWLDEGKEPTDEPE